MLPSAGSITYKLDNRAYVIVLRVMEGGTIEQLLPSGSGVTRATPKGTYPIEAMPPPAYPPAPQVPAGIVYGPCASVSDTAFTKPDPDCWTPDRALMASDPRPVPRRGRDVEAGYWLVITSDVATSAAAVDARLRALDLEDGTLLHTVRQIPAALIGGHTTNWSAFYVGFAVIPTATAKH